MTWRQRPVAWWLAGRDVQLVQLHQRVADAVAGERGHGRDEVRDVAVSQVRLEGVEVLVDLVEVEPARRGVGDLDRGGGRELVGGVAEAAGVGAAVGDEPVAEPAAGEGVVVGMASSGLRIAVSWAASVAFITTCMLSAGRICQPLTGSRAREMWPSRTPSSAGRSPMPAAMGSPW